MGILDFRFWIFDWTHDRLDAEIKSAQPSLQSKIQNLKSKIIWRKGWDSNPRYPFEVHSISSAASSATPAPFRKKIPNFKLQIPNHDSNTIWNLKSGIWNLYGGEGGIRTHGTR